MDPAASASPPPAATNASWAILNCDVSRRDESVVVADAKTVADCRTSAFGGGQLRVSLSLAPPPQRSFLCYDWTGSDALFRVVATHGDSVLINAPNTGDFFLYRASAATRPPWLSQLLLHARDVPSGVRWTTRIGLLRRSEDELLVAQLELTWSCSDNVDTFLAEVWVLRDGAMREWELKPAIILDVDDEGDGAVKRDRLWLWSFPRYAEGGKVVPVGNRFLCWVSFNLDFVLLCDMAEECSSRLRFRYVPLPMVSAQRTDSYSDDYDDWPEIESSRDICGVGDGALKLVSINLRCCCCAKSSNAFLVTTWTLALRTDEDGDDGPIAWVKDAALDCEELWALPGYDGLPRVQPTCPVVSLDNPDVVCFEVGEVEFEGWKERKVWMVAVDMRKKVLLSVVRCTRDWSSSHLPVKLHC